MLLRGYYRPSDAYDMYRLDLDCFTPPFQFSQQMMTEVAETEDAIVVIAEDSLTHEMKGFVILHLQGEADDRFAYVVTIDVAPSDRQQGVGAWILNHAEQQARAAGVHRVALHVAVNNTAAIRFYERLKYARIGTAKNFYSEAGVDALVFGKRLESKRSSRQIEELQETLRHA